MKPKDDLIVNDYEQFLSNFEILTLNLTEIKSCDTIMIIDMQNDFVLHDAPLYVNGAEQIIPKINEIIKYCRNNNISLFFTRDYHLPSDNSFIENGGKFPPHCIANTKGSHIIDDFVNLVNELYVSQPINYSHSHSISKISILFKSFDSEIDSFGAFHYPQEYADLRDLDNDGIVNKCDTTFTGSYGVQITQVSDLNMDPEPSTIRKKIELNVFKSAESLITSIHDDVKAKATLGDLYITGVALDYCVLDTAITGRHSGKFKNIYILVDVSRPVNFSHTSIKRLIHQWNIKLAVIKID